MTLATAPSRIDRETIAARLLEARARTLLLVTPLSDDDLHLFLRRKHHLLRRIEVALDLRAQAIDSPAQSVMDRGQVVRQPCQQAQTDHA